MPLSPTYTFVAHTKAEASKVNANFLLFQQCVNIAGDTLTGTLNTRALVPTANNTYDLGSSSNRFKDIFAAGTANLATITSTAFTVSLITPTTIAGNPTFSGTPTISDGSAIAGITEAHITDGSILARVAANEVITGVYTFTGLPSASTPTISNVTPGIYFHETDASSNHKNWYLVADGGIFQLQHRTDADGIALTGLSINHTTGNMNTAAALTTGAGITASTGNIASTAGDVTASAGNVSAGLAVAAGTTVTAGIYLIGTSGVREHSRSFSMGDTQTRGASSGNYTSTGGTWTSVTPTGESWRVVGDTMTFSFYATSTTVGGTTTALNIALPGGFTAGETTRTGCGVVDGAGPSLFLATAGINSGATTIVINYANGAVFTNGTTNQTVYFQLTFKVV